MSARRLQGAELKPFNDDSYGDDVRDSRLADELELEALSTVVTVGALQDRMADRTMDDGLTMPSDESGEDDSSLKLVFPSELEASLVWDVLKERQRILGDQYPFAVTDGSLSLRGPKSKRLPYLAFLAIAWAHAVAFRLNPTVEVLFEELVQESVGAWGLRTAVLRTNSTHQGSFAERLQTAGGHLGFVATPSAVSFRTQAKDSGVDVVANLDWQDGRPGRWWLLGQATCGRSDSWSAKMTQPKPEKWRRWFNEAHAPQRFLALPHHVTSRALQHILEEGEGFVLDRLRLVLAKPTLSKPIREMTKVILSAHATHDA